MLYETDDEHEIARRSRKQLMDKISAYIHTIGWCIGAIFIIYYGDVWKVITIDPRVNTTFLWFGICELIGLGIVMLYLALYIPCTEKIRVIDYNKFCPRACQTGAALGFTSYFCFLIASWPVWQYVTPIMLVVLYFAAILFPNFFPNCC